jgi:sortase A
LKKTTLARYLLLIIGVSCLSFYGYTALELRSSQAQADWSFEHAPRPPVAIPLERGAVVGRLVIPKLHFTAMVREGTDAKTLRLAVGHIPQTPLPGHPGNVGISAHRDTFFRHLGELKVGDEIGFSTVDGDFSYEVASLKIVDPKDVGVLASSQEKVLTMVTCYPFYYIGNAPKRYIVRALQK